jgi:peptidoglycan/LPS O-acetylase OafA/YrhL
MLALVTAVLLYVGAGWQVPVQGLAQVLKRLGDSAYALFLVHFGMIVVGAAISIELALDQPEQALALVGLLWVSSLVLGDAFHRRVELPLQRWVRGDLGLARATQSPPASV